jgi:hypothetical protein
MTPENACLYGSEPETPALFPAAKPFVGGILQLIGKYFRSQSSHHKLLFYRPLNLN